MKKKERMIELVYHSLADTNLTSKEITDILKVSKKWNAKNDITDCLLYHSDEFLQILKGKDEVVYDLFSKINKDKRHSHVQLLATENITQRMSPNWSMAFYQFDNESLDKTLFSKNIQSFSNIANRFNYVLDLF